MLSGKQKQRLQDLFFLDNTPPDLLDPEELEYWLTLSRQWDEALSSVYQRILHLDSSCDRGSQPKK